MNNNTINQAKAISELKSWVEIAKTYTADEILATWHAVYDALSQENDPKTNGILLDAQNKLDMTVMCLKLDER